LKDIAIEKSNIFNSMKEHSNAIIYREAAYFDLLKSAANYKGLKIITFGESEDSDIRITNNCEFIIDGKTYKLKGTPAAKHIMLDMAAAIAIARDEQIPMNEILPVLEKFKPIEGRGQELQIQISGNKTIKLIDESYNANPISMKAAIEGFGELHADKEKIIILGDMAECGSESARYHRELVEPIKKISPQKIILCGNEMKNLYDVIKDKYDCYYYSSYEDMNKQILNLLDNNSCVMIKSSNSSKLYKTVELLKTPL